MFNYLCLFDMGCLRNLVNVLIVAMLILYIFLFIILIVFIYFLFWVITFLFY